MTRVDALIDRYGPAVAGMLVAFELHTAGGTLATTSTLTPVPS